MTKVPDSCWQCHHCCQDSFYNGSHHAVAICMFPLDGVEGDGMGDVRGRGVDPYDLDTTGRAAWCPLELIEKSRKAHKSVLVDE